MTSTRPSEIANPLCQRESIRGNRLLARVRDTRRLVTRDPLSFEQQPVGWVTTRPPLSPSIDRLGVNRFLPWSVYAAIFEVAVSDTYLHTHERFFCLSSSKPSQRFDVV